MLVELRPEVIEALNLQYKTDSFRSLMSASQIVNCAEMAMRKGIDSINYEIEGWLADRYRIKTQTCLKDPFSQQQKESLKMLTVLSQELLASNFESSLIVNQKLEQLKDYVIKFGTKLKVSHAYHKYLLYFKNINIKEAILFEILSQCQIFYTIARERKKSGKQFYMDPLLNCFENIKNKLRIIHPFHEKVLPRKQLRFFEKKVNDKKMKNTLFEAVSNRRHQEVKQLIAKGASIEQPGIHQRQQKREMNCSHRACQLGDLKMCRILHAYKVNWEARDKEGMTPLHFAVQSGNLQLVVFLHQQAKVNLEARDTQERTPFYFACTEGDLNIIKYLYDLGCDINNKSKLGRSALSKACYLGLVDVVSFLMSCPGIILQVEDGKGRTALHNAVFGPKGGRQGHKFGTNQKDSPECTQLLLQKGFNVDYLDKEQNTPLHVSMSSDGIDSIRVLLAYGASLSKLNCYGETPLMTGAKFGHLASVKVLHQQFGSSLTVKDIFNKNLMLLCAKFRQDDGKSINSVFYYSTDELLRMAHKNEPLLLSEICIKDWSQEIDYTFNQLLREHDRADVQFRYFCHKCMELDLIITHLSLDQLKSLFSLIDSNELKEDLEIIEFVIAGRPNHSKLVVKLTELQDFVRWILLKNSIPLLQFVSRVQNKLKRYLTVVDSEQQFSFLHCLSSVFFSSISDLKEKVITHCLLKLNINWLDYIHQEHYYNILHLLVRSKKVGSLIQILKVLSGVKMDFITNSFILDLLQEDALHYQKQQEGESPLAVVLKNLLIHKDRQGFDPYQLALLVKDASSSKLLQDKMSKQAGFSKSEFEVKQYSFRNQTDPKEIEQFNKGYQIEEKLEGFTHLIEDCQVHQLKEYFGLLDQSKHQADPFHLLWKKCSQRKIVFISKVNEIGVLENLQNQTAIGIDIEYFYSEGTTLISIMQLSSENQDYIIDFLTSAQEQHQSEEFILAVRKALVGIAYNTKITKIMHGSDNDLCVIKSVLKFSFLNFLDTARVDVQIRKQQNIRGLATLVKDYLNEHMSKDYQVSEWRIRPIPASMIEYARKDSLVLPFLARVMLSLLSQQKLKEVLLAGCRQARKNKKANQSCVKSIQAL